MLISHVCLVPSLASLKRSPQELAKLESMIYSVECCTEGGFSYDDIDLWSRLRSISLIKGAVFPTKVREYMDYHAKRCDVPLYWNMAV